MVQAFADHRDSPVAVRFPMVDALLCISCRFSRAAVEKTLALPLLQLVEKSVTFYGPSYLAVTCSAFAFGVQVYGLFWEMTSGYFPVSRIQHSLVRQWIHVTSDYGGLLASTLQETAESP